MKKLLYKLFVFLIILLVFRLLLGIIYKDNTGEKLFKLRDLSPASAKFTTDNGYYKLWTLIESEKVDINSKQIYQKYKGFLDSGLNRRAKNNKWYEKKCEKFSSQYKDQKKMCGAVFPETWEPEEWYQFILNSKKELTCLISHQKALLDRYDNLIRSERVEDFSNPEMKNFPCFKALFTAWNLFLAKNIYIALDGKWEEAIENLLNQIHFFKKLIPASRSIILSQISNNYIVKTIQIISILMNQEDCPPIFFKKILEQLSPSFTYREINLRNALIGDSLLSIVNLMDEGMLKEPEEYFFGRLFLYIFLDKHATHQYIHNIHKELIQLEKIPPYKWATDPLKEWKFEKPLSYPKFFYELFTNCVGKSLLWDYSINILKIRFQLKSYYDILLILAELHLNYSPEKSLENNLTFLPQFKKNKDPFTGEPYSWDKQKRILYSKGKGISRHPEEKGPFIFLPFNIDKYKSKE